jgi:hypothetical protein
MIKVTTNLADLNKSLALYQTLSGLSSQDVLAKQGGKFARNLAVALRHRMMSKGGIREEALAVLKSGRMIRVRDKVRDQVDAKWSKTWAKKTAKHEKSYWGDPLNEGFNRQQELVRREIAVRESGRGFLSVSSRYPISVSQGMKAISRYSQALSDVGMKLGGDEQHVRFSWSGLSRQGKGAARGLTAPKGIEAINEAINELREDIGLYTARKQMALMKGVMKSVVKAGAL